MPINSVSECLRLYESVSHWRKSRNFNQVNILELGRTSNISIYKIYKLLCIHKIVLVYMYINNTFKIKLHIFRFSKTMEIVVLKGDQ